MKTSYDIPQARCIIVHSTGIVCTSPTAGGSEGTGDENLFPIKTLDSDDNLI